MDGTALNGVISESVELVYRLPKLHLNRLVRACDKESFFPLGQRVEPSRLISSTILIPLRRNALSGEGYCGEAKPHPTYYRYTPGSM